MKTDPFIRIDTLGGNCPVQSEGEIGGVPFYFRARGEHWSMSIGGDDIYSAPDWRYDEPYGEDDYAAGWMPLYEALGFMARAFGLYANRESA